MRAKRVIGMGESCYHVLSRINEKRFYLGKKQKAVFRDMMQRAAVFSGVEILTFCIMSNHFHILVRVPEPVNISDDELKKRLHVLYRGNDRDDLLDEFDRYLREGNEHMCQMFRSRYLRRMYDLTEFVRTLKQRFSIWYNQHNDRVGPLWDGRFKSVLVQSSADELGVKALSVMAAYIDLNAVRAGLVDDPKDYVWCGYAEAVAGKPDAIKGLQYVFRGGRGIKFRKKDALHEYRNLLLVRGLRDGDGFSAERIKQLLAQNEGLSVGELLRCKVRYFSYGRVLGGSHFVDGVTHARRECFPSRRGALPICELASEGLYTANRPRIQAVSRGLRSATLV